MRKYDLFVSLLCIVSFAAPSSGEGLASGLNDLQILFTALEEPNDLQADLAATPLEESFSSLKQAKSSISFRAEMNEFPFAKSLSWMGIRRICGHRLL